MSELDPKISDYMRSLGQKGGKTTTDRFGKEHFAKIGAKGAKSRWEKIKGRKDDEGTEEAKEGK